MYTRTTFGNPRARPELLRPSCTVHRYHFSWVLRPTGVDAYHTYLSYSLSIGCKSSYAPSGRSDPSFRSEFTPSTPRGLITTSSRPWSALTPNSLSLSDLPGSWKRNALQKRRSESCQCAQRSLSDLPGSWKTNALQKRRSEACQCAQRWLSAHQAAALERGPLRGPEGRLKLRRSHQPGAPRHHPHFFNLLTSDNHPNKRRAEETRGAERSMRTMRDAMGAWFADPWPVAG
eukprot:32802-Prorocentrum_minimum.AAC.3